MRFQEWTKQAFENHYGREMEDGDSPFSEGLDFVDAYYSDSDNFMSNLAHFEGPDGYKIGKDVLLGSDWMGVKYSYTDDDSYVNQMRERWENTDFSNES